LRMLGLAMVGRLDEEIARQRQKRLDSAPAGLD
jgi:hypothetical protein